jgi:hypothetical protein
VYIFNDNNHNWKLAIYYAGSIKRFRILARDDIQRSIEKQRVSSHHNVYIINDYLFNTRFIIINRPMKMWKQ